MFEFLTTRQNNVLICGLASGFPECHPAFGHLFVQIIHEVKPQHWLQFNSKDLHILVIDVI